MTQDQMLRIIINALDSKKAEGIRAIKITDLTILSDYFVIANGTSTAHTKTLAEEVENQFSKIGIEPNKTEGYNGSNWVVLDYDDIVVHVFNKETRDYYQLERLWSDGESIDVEKYLTKE